MLVTIQRQITSVHTSLYQSLTIKMKFTYQTITITCSYHGKWNSN